MHKRMKSVVVAASMLVLATVSTVLLAQNKHANSPAARDAVTSTAEGKILWQYNTHG
jgi:hypothetical protein